MATLKDYRSNKLENAGDFNISEVVLFTPTGQVAALTSAVAEISIYEDLNSNFLSGSLVIIDTVDIVNTLPILGQEYLEFKVRTPIESVYDEGEYDFTNTKMAVYKVTRQRLNQNTQAVTLDFISTEGIRDQNVRISRAFDGPYDDAVAKIFKKSWGLNSKKKLYVQPTTNNFKFVAPNQRPTDIINMICSRAVPKTSKTPAYVFYENGQGFHFRSVDSFYYNVKTTGLEKHPEMFEYFLDSDNTRGFKSPQSNPLSLLRTVYKFSLKQYNDLIQAQRLGTYASKLITHDAFNKTYQEHKYNYIEDYINEAHLEHQVSNDDEGVDYQGLIVKAHYDFNDTESPATDNTFGIDRSDYKYLSDYADARIMLQSNTAKIHNTNSDNGYRVNEYLQERQSILNIYRNLEIELTVPGNTHLNIGHIIRLNVPRSGPSKGDTKSSQNDRYMSGRWLITAIRHKFDFKTSFHTMVLTCMKDTYGVPTPQSDKQLNITSTDEGQPLNIYDQSEYD